MKIVFLILALTFFFLVPTFSQEVKKDINANKPTLNWNGFVKAEALFDTRQVVEAREGYLMLYPKKVALDQNGIDINNHGSFNQYAMTARLAARITGPDVLNAKASALIEGDFTGASNSENNSFRLRHAYLKLKWEHVSILSGQYWHPINVPEMIPNVLALNTGAPFHPYSRQPQIRIDVSGGKLNAVLAIIAQRDYANLGPSGTTSAYLRNSIVPNIHGQLQFTGTRLFAGAAVDFKRLTPRIVTDSLYVTDAAVNCLSYTAFAQLKTKPVTFKMQWLYGQGMNDHTLLGGYGVTHTDLYTNEQSYSCLNYLSGWINIQTNGKQWQGSLFAGYTKGFGSDDVITGAVYARDADIAYIYRIAPMLTYINGKLTLAAEIDYTTAAYGKTDAYLKVVDAKPVSNTRFDFSVGYFF